MKQVVIEACPFLDVKEIDDRTREELYSRPFDVSLIANKQGSRPEKRFGFWESDNAYTDRLEKWENEEKLVIFEGWTCKDMFHFQEVYHRGKNIIITFETNEYEVNYFGRKFLFPTMPETVNDFINDMKRIGITLFWKQEIADIYGIEKVTSNKIIVDYYRLIKKIGDRYEDNMNGSST